MASPHHAIKRGIIARIPSIHHEHSSYKWWVLLNVMIGTFVAVLDSTIVNVGLSKIMASLGATIDSIEWIMTGYNLALGVMLPASGWIADHLGYKKTYFTALTIFTLGSFLCGLSWNESSLITFRLLQGLGAGMLMPVGLATIMREFPKEQRGMAMGFWGIAAAASVSFGPLIGGYLVDNISWQAIFFVNVPIGIFGLLVTLIIQREYKTDNTRDFDFLGFLSITAFLTSMLLGLSEGNAAWNTGGWTSPVIVGCVTIAFVSLIIFLIVETRQEHPFIEIKLFKNFNFTASNAIMFIFGIGMFGSTFLMPLYWQNALGYTAIMAGSMFLPVGILQAFASPISGILADKISPKVPASIGIILLVISLYLNSQLTLQTEKPFMYMLLAIRGLAMGLIFTPLTTVSLLEIPRDKMAQASGLINVIRQIGGSFGIAIFGSILTRRTVFHASIYGQSLDSSSPIFRNTYFGIAGHFTRDFNSSPGVAGSQAGALIMSEIQKQAFVHAICDCFIIAAIVTLAILVPVFILRAGKKNDSVAEEVVVLD